MTVQGKMRWGDTLDDDDVLPQRVVRGPDEHGIKTVIEYYRNDAGDAFKKTSKLKVVTVEKKVYTISEERKNWPKFGAALKETPQDSVTVQTVEEIPFERVHKAKGTSKEKTDVATLLQKPAEVGASLKDILYRKRMEREMLRAKGLLAGAEKPPDEDGPSKPESSLGAPKPGSYVPPSLRNRGPGATMGGDDAMQRRREENSVRVTNLSEDVTEQDLGELFRPFGHIQRIYLAVDRVTGESRGFAFVTFAHREDGERAIRTLNGYGYGHLILSCSWAAPREDRK